MIAVMENGEPVVQSRGSSSREFAQFEHALTGEWSQRRPPSSVRSQYEPPPLINMSVTNRVFQFIPTECCSEDQYNEVRSRKYTVEVRRSQSGYQYWDRKKIRGCCCQRCRGWQLGHSVGTQEFLHKVTRVRFEI